MKRLATILFCLAAATGCARITDMDSDAFAQGNVPQEIFQLDSLGCQDAAETKRSYDVRGIDAEPADKHRIYSRAYAACMTAKGYKPRTSWYDFWQAYDL